MYFEKLYPHSPISLYKPNKSCLLHKSKQSESLLNKFKEEDRIVEILSNMHLAILGGGPVGLGMALAAIQ